MNWEDRVEGPGEEIQRLQDQITVLSSELRSARAIAGYDIKKEFRRAIDGLNMVTQQMLRLAELIRLEDANERNAGKKVQRASTDRVQRGRKASGNNTGKLLEMPEVPGGQGLRDTGADEKSGD